jgi:hypothetical protein
MRATMNFILPAFVSILAVALPASPPVSAPAFCVVPPPRVSAEDLVRTADVIVRVVAVRERTGAAADSVGLDGHAFSPILAWLEFDVVEVLKGGDIPAKLYLPGNLVEEDDFNTGRVPNRYPRSVASDGDFCYAYGYRRGGEFLLVLRNMTPYYASAPTNEQVRGADDPWVRWVRARLARARNRRR